MLLQLPTVPLLAKLASRPGVLPQVKAFCARTLQHCSADKRLLAAPPAEDGSGSGGAVVGAGSGGEGSSSPGFKAGSDGAQGVGGTSSMGASIVQSILMLLPAADDADEAD